jgi:hypothetical protein
MATAFDSAVRSGATQAPATPGSVAEGGSSKNAFRLDSAAPVPTALNTLHDNRQALLECIKALSAGPLLTPLGVDFATFSSGQAHLRNAPAVVILLARFDGKRDAAYIVGPRCDAAQQDIYDFELLTGTG